MRSYKKSTATEKAVILYYLEKILWSAMPKNIEADIMSWVKDFGEYWLAEKHIGAICRGRGISPNPVWGSKDFRLTLREAKRAWELETQSYDWRAVWDRANAKADAVFDIFGLPKKIREPLRFLIHVGDFSSSLGNLWGHFTTEHDPAVACGQYRCLARITGVGSSTIDDFLDEDGQMYEKGILDRESDFAGELAISRKFRQIMNCKQATREAITDFILKDRVRAQLKPEDYRHIEDEFSYIRSLLSNAVATGAKGVNILLYGEPGTGKSQMASTLAASIGGAALYSVGGGESAREKDDRLGALALTQYILGRRTGTILVFDETEDVFFDGSFDGKNASSKQFKNRLLENNPSPVIWTTNEVGGIDPAFIRRFTYALELPKPDERAKIKIWKTIARKNKLRLSDKRIAELARKYDTPPSIIETAVRAAMLAEDERAIGRTIEALQKATYGFVPMREDYGLGTFNPMLLNTDENLEELARKLSASKSETRRMFSICLFGPAGTGKSAFARYLADKMEMPVLQKRASDLQDMYVGQTEKNIARAFREAKDKKAMLVFDEADSFLQARRPGQHSWEISGVNEMLTQMEHARFPFICTTNMLDMLDPASLRRFTFKVKYDYMRPDQVRDAFRHFFGKELDKSHSMPGATPGDFVVVKKRAEVMDITDAAELARMLEKEIAFKNANTRVIGFGR